MSQPAIMETAMTLSGISVLWRYLAPSTSHSDPTIKQRLPEINLQWNFLTIFFASVSTSMSTTIAAGCRLRRISMIRKIAKALTALISLQAG
jgi:hypothetical protein